MSDTSLNLYKVFCVVVETENYTEASRKLYVTESTISSHIKNLEETLNVTLFYRENGKLTLTKAGEELYNSIHSRIDEIEFAENAIIQNYDISKAKITIGCPSHIATFYLSKCIEMVRKDYPDMKIDVISVADYNGLIKLLKKHTVDFVILDIIPDDEKSKMKIKPLKKVNNVFISKELIEIKDLKELEKHKYILNYENSISTRQLFEVLQRYDVKIRADIQADSTEVRIKETKKSQGIGYVMKEAADEEIENKEVYEVKLPIELPEMNINLVYMEKYLTKNAEIFIKRYLK